MNSLQDQGRALYKRREYRKAIECFDRAIGRATSIQLLDNRAACYEKLGELSTALKDAKAAIQMKREDATGYLRAGKVLMKMEKPAVALDIYTHGLKCIKHVGQGYEILKKSHKEVLEIVSPSKSVDPLTMLPRELALVILEQLSFRQRMNACLVSKGWAQFVRSSPELWSHLDLSGARKKKVPTAFISRAINTGRTRLRKASLNKLFDFDKTLAALIKQCPLEELALLECGLQGPNLPRILKAAKHLRSFQLEAGTTLIDTDLNGLLDDISDRLETISVDISKSIRLTSVYPHLTSFHATVSANSEYILLQVPSCFPNIKYLTLHQRGLTRQDEFSRLELEFELDKCQQLSRLDLAAAIRRWDILRLPRSLTSLTLVPLAGGRHRLHDCLVNTRTQLGLPILEHLAISPGSPDCSSAVSIILRGWDKGGSLPPSDGGPVSNLRSLSITDAGEWLTTENLVPLTSEPRFKELEHLALNACVQCDDEMVELVVQVWPRLRTLNLANTKVTGVGVKEAAKLEHLEELILDDCRFLGADAVQWAREKGLKVRYKMKSEAAGGKKVRY